MTNGTKSTFRLKLNNLNIADVSKITTVFKQFAEISEEPLLIKKYPEDDSIFYDAESGKLHIPITTEESWLFANARRYYIEAEITMTDGTVIKTNTVGMQSGKTIIGKDDIDG